jgi:hypothetical protein
MGSVPECENAKRAKRTAMLRKTKLHTAKGLRSAVRLSNLSETGLGGVSDIHLMHDEILSVTLDGIGPVKGHVVWVKGKRFGMVFDVAIDPENLTDNHVESVATPKGFRVHDCFQPITDYKRPGLNRFG